MAAELDALKEVVINVVNGQVSPKAVIVQAAQDAKKKVMSEAKYIADTTKIVVPQEAELTKQLAKLEAEKVVKIGLKIASEEVVKPLDMVIEEQEAILVEVQKAEAIAKKQQDRKAAKAKAKGEEAPPPKDTEKSSRKMKEAIDVQKEQSDRIHKEIEILENDIKELEDQISEVQKTMKFLAAQLSPAAALAEAKVKKTQAQQKVDNAQTPEAKKEAEKELEEAEQEETTMQAISDDHDQALENTETLNDPKLMQLRAEFQIMDSGVTTMQYLTTNFPLLLGPSGLMAVPTTLVAGSAVGTANPVYGTLFGNVLYAYGFFVLATIKAASIRFLAIAQEIDYTPTDEMAIINSIAPVEIAWKSATAAFAPAGSALI